MKEYRLWVDNETRKSLSEFLKTVPFLRWNFVANAIACAIAYYKRNGRMPSAEAEDGGRADDAGKLARAATDLDGLTRDVILSHLVRFPKVTPASYAAIIEKLRLRILSSDGLKNAEAAAYGLCKQLQYGGGRQHAQPQQPQQPQPQQQQAGSKTQNTPIPPEALRPYSFKRQ